MNYGLTETQHIRWKSGGRFIYHVMRGRNGVVAMCGTRVAYRQSEFSVFGIGSFHPNPIMCTNCRKSCGV